MYKKPFFKLIIAALVVIAAGIVCLGIWFRQLPTIKKHPFANCILTQHFDATGAQCMFYTLETFEGLVVIDGGAAANSEYVRSVIESKGNHVSAWIITHAHPDHVGAFNEIYSDPQDIVIDNIYTTDFDLEKYHELCNWWDEPEYYDKFWSLTHGGTTDGEANDNLHLLRGGDSIEICGLSIDVFSSFSDVGCDYGDDIANLGSLVFKVTAGKKSILFCSDVHNNRGLYDDIASRWGNKKIEQANSLHADFLQMGHHGNNSCTHEFIDLVNPDIAFMDCPDGFFDSDDYDARENREYLEEKGIKVYSFSTAPNEFVL